VFDWIYLCWEELIIPRSERTFENNYLFQLPQIPAPFAVCVAVCVALYVAACVAVCAGVCAGVCVAVCVAVCACNVQLPTSPARSSVLQCVAVCCSVCLQCATTDANFLRLHYHPLHSSDPLFVLPLRFLRHFCVYTCRYIYIYIYRLKLLVFPSVFFDISVYTLTHKYIYT